MSYPKSMNFAVSRLSGFSKQNTIIRPQSQEKANPNDVIVFELPVNTLVDLRSFCVYALGTTTATGGTTPSAVFPKHIETVIDSIQVEIGGVLVDNGFLQYGNLHKLYMDFLAGVDRTNSSRCLLQQGDLTTLGLSTGAVGASALADSTVQTNIPVVFNSFLGFLSAKCPIIDTSILPSSVRVLIRLAPNSVLVTKGSPTSFGYSLDKLFATIDVINMNDGFYYDMIQQKLAEAPLEIMFDKHYLFQNGSTNAGQVTRWAVNSQSIDWVIGTHFANVSRTAPNAIDAVANTSQYFKRDGSEVNESFFTFNNVQYPQWVPNNANGSVLGQTLLNLNVLPDLAGGSDGTMNTYSRWRSSFYAHVHRFNHLPSSDDDSRLISGLNSMGQNAQGQYTTTAISGASGTYWPQVWVKTTATLAIKANRMFEIRN